MGKNSSKPVNGNPTALPPELSRKGHVADAMPSPKKPLQLAIQSAARGAKKRGGVGAEDMALEERIVRFYTKYNPSNVSRVPEILSKWTGNHEELISTLVARYGPEPATDGGEEKENVKTKKEASQVKTVHSLHETDAPLQMQHSFRRRVSALLGVRAPGKEHQIERYLKKYAGAEEQALSTLCAAYGSEPSQEEALAYFVRRLEKLYECNFPDKVGAAAAEIAAHYGKEEEYIQAQAKALGVDLMVPGALSQRRDPMSASPELGVVKAELTQVETVKETPTMPNVPLNVEQNQKEVVGDEASQHKVENVLAEEIIIPRLISLHATEEVPAICTNTQLSTADMSFEFFAEKPVEKVSNTGSGAKDEVEELRDIMNEQQQQLKGIQTGVNRLCSLLNEVEPSTRLSHHNRGSIDDERNVYSTTFEKFLFSKGSGIQKKHDFDLVKRGASLSNDCMYTKEKVIDDFLPPPLPFHETKKFGWRIGNALSKRSSFLVVGFLSESQPVRTLVEMRMEYERELEEVRRRKEQSKLCDILV